VTDGEGRGAAPPFRFRAAEEADFERLLDLSIRALRADLERLGRWDPARRRARMRASFDPAATRRIEDPAGRLLGCVTHRHHAGHTEITNLYLEPDCQGRGLGSAVMAALLAERPDLPVLLEVLKESPALRFYARLGFVPEREQAFDWLLRLPPRA